MGLSVRVFGQIVPDAEFNGIFGVGLIDEGDRVFFGIYAALQFQTKLGGGRERVPVFRLCGAEVALGVDVQANGFGDSAGKVLVQKGNGAVFVAIIDASFGGVFAQVVKKMADVVQEAGGDEGVRFAGRFCPGGALKRVLKLRDGFASVLFAAASAEAVKDGGKGRFYDGIFSSEIHDGF